MMKNSLTDSVINFIKSSTLRRHQHERLFRKIESRVRSNQISPGAVASDFHKNASSDQSWGNAMANLDSIAITVDNMVESVMLILQSSENCQIGDIQIRPTMSIP